MQLLHAFRQKYYHVPKEVLKFLRVVAHTLCTLTRQHSFYKKNFSFKSWSFFLQTTLFFVIIIIPLHKGIPPV